MANVREKTDFGAAGNEFQPFRDLGVRFFQMIFMSDLVTFFVGPISDQPDLIRFVVGANNFHFNETRRSIYKVRTFLKGFLYLRRHVVGNGKRTKGNKHKVFIKIGRALFFYSKVPTAAPFPGYKIFYLRASKQKGFDIKL
jgi:hypothetical protein